MPAAVCVPKQHTVCVHEAGPVQLLSSWLYLSAARVCYRAARKACWTTPTSISAQVIKLSDQKGDTVELLYNFSNAISNTMIHIIPSTIYTKPVKAVPKAPPMRHESSSRVEIIMFFLFTALSFTLCKYDDKHEV